MSGELNCRILHVIDKNDGTELFKCIQNFHPNGDHQYVNRAARLGNTQCLQVLISANWPGVWEGTGLTHAVKNHHRECVNLLLDRSSTTGKYMAFHAAIAAKNSEFLNVFIPTIPRNSYNWYMVFDALLKADLPNLVQLALENSNWQSILERNQDKPQSKKYLEAFEKLSSERQKLKILNNVCPNQNARPTRKM